MTKKGPMLLAFFVGSAACVSTPPVQKRDFYAHYTVKLAQASVHERGGRTQPLTVTKDHFGDNNAYFRITPQPNGSHFQMTNRTGGVEKILWDDATIVGPDQTSHKVTHGDGRLMVGRPMESTAVDPVSSYEDSIASADTFAPDELKNTTLEQATAHAKAFAGRRFTATLPVQTESGTFDYQMIFEFTGGTASSDRPTLPSDDHREGRYPG